MYFDPMYMISVKSLLVANSSILYNQITRLISSRLNVRTEITVIDQKWVIWELFSVPTRLESFPEFYLHSKHPMKSFCNLFRK